MDFFISVLYLAAIITGSIIAFRSYRNRFLPMAIPICILSALMVFICTLQFYINFYSTGVNSAPLNKLVIIFGLSVSFFILPLWFWIMGEYKASQKVHFKHYTWLLIEPAIAFTILLFNKVEMPSSGYSSLAKQAYFLGNYASPHRTYMTIIAIILVIWSALIIRQKAQKSIVPLLQFSFCIATPMFLFYAYQTGYLSRPIGSTTLILLLVWAAKQSNLLDIIPSALSGILNKVSAGVMVFNARQHKVYQNQFATRFFKDLTLAQTPSDLLFKTFDFSKSLPQTAQLVLKNKETNQIHYIDAFFEPIINVKTQQNLGSVVLLQDISARKKSELSLAESNQRLIDLGRLKSSFFAGISHEFRTPLTLVIGGLDDVLSGEFGAVTDQQQQAIIDIKNNNQRLLNLVSQLLELSQLNDGQMSFSPKTIYLSNYIPMIISNFESAALKQNTHLSFQDNSKCSEICIDIDVVDKVLMNLLSNALKSIQNRGHITVSISDDENDALVLQVKDTGHGIAPSALPHIFDAFYSQEVPHPNWPSGTGIGLHFIKQLLISNNSTISATSTLNYGSEFTVKFNKVNASRIQATKTETDHTPPSPPEVASTPVNTEVPLLTPPNTEKLILVVEDNIEMRRYIRRHLGKQFRLIEAEDGEEGFELAKHSVPDLILTDIMMPKVDGLELSQFIRNHSTTSHIPIIVLTAKSLTSEKQRGLELGIDDFLTKPFNAQELIARCHNLMHSRDQLKRHYQHQQDNCDSKPALPKKEILFIEKLHAFVIKNLSNQKLLIRDIASYVHMSERSLHRKLNALTGLPPKQWLINVKVAYAKQQLIETDNSITHIAFEAGFSDPSHFSKTFKGQCGLSPLQYRERN